MNTEDRRRQQVIEEARACGRMGWQRPSNACLFGEGDPSDTQMVRILAAFEEGKKERTCVP